MESLAENEQFVSAVMQATPIAARTHHREKLEALRNSVLNVAVGRAPEDDLQEVFLSYIEAMTTLQLQILGYFAHPRQMPLEELAFLRQWDLARQAAVDLESRGLIARSHLPIVTAPLFGTIGDIEERPTEYFWRTPEGQIGPHAEITEFGRAFFSFILSPIPDEGPGSSTEGAGEQ